MRSWIKAMIKSSVKGYLTLYTSNTGNIIPFYYNYERGRLFSSFSILQSKAINLMQNYPIQYLTISGNGDKEVGILGKLVIHSDDLDSNWKKYPSNLYQLVKKGISEVDKIPHSSKAVVVEFIPRRIDAREKEEKISYEMEILL